MSRRSGLRRTDWVPPEEHDGYAGPAILRVDGRDLPVRVRLAGHLEPLDGRYHWYGRVERTDAVVAAKDAGAARAELVVGGGAAAGLRLAEYDAWGNVLVSGVGAPPYPLPPVDLEAPATR